jgi:hypothetical protein
MNKRTPGTGAIEKADPLRARILQLLQTLSPYWSHVDLSDTPQLTTDALTRLMHSGNVQGAFKVRGHVVGKMTQITATIHATGEFTGDQFLQPVVECCKGIPEWEGIPPQQYNFLKNAERIRLTSAGEENQSILREQAGIARLLASYIATVRVAPTIDLKDFQATCGQSTASPSITAAQANASIGDIHIHNVVQVPAAAPPPAVPSGASVGNDDNEKPANIAKRQLISDPDEADRVLRATLRDEIGRIRQYIAGEGKWIWSHRALASRAGIRRNLLSEAGDQKTRQTYLEFAQRVRARELPKWLEGLEDTGPINTKKWGRRNARLD